MGRIRELDRKMHTGKTIASAVILGLAVINWLRIEEVAKATRLLPDNLFTNRSEFQFIDQEIRGAVRRYVRSEERNSKDMQTSVDAVQASIAQKSPAANVFHEVSAGVRIQNYLNANSDNTRKNLYAEWQ